jgi:peptide/nickel transport system permease protein
MTYKRLWRHKSARIGSVLVILTILMAVFASQIAPYDPYDQVLRDRLDPPSREHWFGTDGHGRDVLSRVIYGARTSLLIGALSVSLGLGIGFVLGLVSGYMGGMADAIIMRMMDIMIAFPGILMAIVVVSVLGPGLYNVMFAIAIRSIPIFARLIRSSVLEVRERDYILSARAIGCPDLRIMIRHIVPNCIAPLLVLATIRFATSILSAAGLSFLGLGAQPPLADWGADLSGGHRYVTTAWWVATFPGLAIMFGVLGFNLIGDGLRDALDPRMRRRL